MSEHFNNLTPAQQERIALLLEEAGEVVQICGKILRHGYESYHPDSGEVNRDALAREVDDLLSVIRLILAKRDFELADESMHSYIDKRKRRYTHHQGEG